MHGSLNSEAFLSICKINNIEYIIYEKDKNNI